MKKLMIAAVAVATVGGAFATPTVYDYKATVKHTYIKEGKAKVNGAAQTLYFKTQKSSSLKGYLVQDTDTEIFKAGNATITSADVQPMNRCFLVVKNGSAEKDYRYVRIVPGILEASWYSSKDLSSSSKASVNSQGYLYLGGEVVTTLKGATFTAGQATLADIEDPVNGIGSGNYAQRAFIASLQTSSPLTTGIDDYWFTSCYLFGQFNQPDWSFKTDTATNVKYRWFFADAWMNGAGLGKASYSHTACCGRAKGGYVLESLSGNVKAGLYLCGLSGSDLDHTDLVGLYGEQIWFEDFKVGKAPTTNTADTWADGTLDLGTTDVGYGTWSIKRNTKLAAKAVVAADVADGVAVADCGAVYSYIKAAALALDKNVTLFGSPISGAMINNEFHKNYLTK